MSLTPERKAKIEKVLSSKQPDLTVVLENVHDPHNTSAVLRTCDAVGVLDVHIVTTIPPSKYRLGKKSSASAKKWLEIHYWDSLTECFTQIREEGKSIMASCLHDKAYGLYEMDTTQPVALVFGNEHRGISEDAFNQCNGLFSIPQHGMIESLNISVACAVTLYEAYRQRQKKGFYNSPQLDGQRLQELSNAWENKKGKMK